MATTYQPHDSLGVLYDNFTTQISSDGTSTAIDFGVAGGCPNGEIVIKIGGRATGESVHIIVQDYLSGSHTDLPLRLYGLAADGEYVIPINNKVVTGSKLRLKHDVTLPTGGQLKIHAHFRPWA